MVAKVSLKKKNIGNIAKSEANYVITSKKIKKIVIKIMKKLKL